MLWVSVALPYEIFYGFVWRRSWIRSHPYASNTLGRFAERTGLHPDPMERIDMSDNDYPENVSAIMQQHEQALADAGQRLMRSWKEDYPNLRAVLLGVEHNGIKWAQGSLTLRRDAHELAAQLTILDYGLQCTLRDSEVLSLLECLEAHLDCKSTPWDRTFREKQRDKQRIANARGGS